MDSQFIFISLCCILVLLSNGCRSEGSQISLPLQCTKDGDCILNSVCVKNQCQCSDGYIFSGNMRNCLRVAQSFGDECAEDLQCSAHLSAGGTCQDGKCTCAVGYHYLHGYCYSSAGLGETCLSSEHCHVSPDINAAICEKSKCRCSDNFYMREYRSCRREAKKIGDGCIIDHDCRFADRVMCDKSKTCQWKPSTRDGLLLNETVVYNADNVLSSLTKIGKACQQIGEFCICDRGYFPVEDQCIPEIGEPCTPEETPVIKNSVCQNGRWNCKITHIPSIDNRQCQKITAKYNTSCLMSEQCAAIFGPDALCLNRRCVCNENSHYVEGHLFCWINRGLGDSCKKNEDCYAAGLDIDLHCNDKFICDCPKGYHTGADKETCIKDDTSLGDLCIVSEDCTVKNSVCHEKSCNCAENYFEHYGKCYNGLSAPCEFNDECFATNSHCSSTHRCTCDEGYIAHSVDSCIQIADYGESCEYDLQCTAKHDNSICRGIDGIDDKLADDEVGKKNCTCVDNYHFNLGACHKKSVLHESCTSLAECYIESGLNSVLCKNDKCTCNYNWIPINNTYCEYNAAGSIVLNYGWILLIILSALCL